MDTAHDRLTAHLLDRLALVQRNLGQESVVPANAAFGEVLDSMALVEFVALVAEDCGVEAEAIERCVGQRFGTVTEMAEALLRAGLTPSLRPTGSPVLAVKDGGEPVTRTCWLMGTSARLPHQVQRAAELDEALGRPQGWLAAHAGIEARHVWKDQDPLAAAAEAARECLAQAELLGEEVGVLLVTSEAPPLLTGLAAALHHRFDLRPQAVALETGGACTGFLAALWLAQRLVAEAEVVLVVAVEAPSRFLTVQPGKAGEAAALFGDAASACVLSVRPTGTAPLTLREVILGADGGAGHLLRVEPSTGGVANVEMNGTALAIRAMKAMAEAAREVVARQGIEVADLAGVVVHGGNGRMPALLARQLGLPAERVWSETAGTGNLGSASLPVAWVARQTRARGAFVWTAAGAGLTWGAALLETGPNEEGPSGVPS
jgi:3-oxoacyl-[acyl-carrier-protein] synthase-3